MAFMRAQCMMHIVISGDGHAAATDDERSKTKILVEIDLHATHLYDIDHAQTACHSIKYTLILMCSLSFRR